MYKPYISPIIGHDEGFLCHSFHRSNHFLDIEGSGEEGKVHSDLVLTEVAEALVVHIVFHLPEDGLWLYWAVGSVLEPFL